MECNVKSGRKPVIRRSFFLFCFKKDKFVRMKLYVHIIFWLAVVALMLAVFTPNLNSLSEAVYFIAMLLPVVFATCYFFNYYLIPRFLFTKKYGKFLLYSFYMLIISLYMEMVVIILSFIFLAKYSYNNMSPVSSDVLVLAITLYFVVLLFSFILLLRRNLQGEKVIGKLEEEKQKRQAGSFTVRSDRQQKTISFDEVLFIESLGDYLTIHLADRSTVTTRERISRLEERLPDQFVRIHRSFLVNREKINSFNRESITTGEHSLPVSRSYREQVMPLLGNVKNQLDN